MNSDNSMRAAWFESCGSASESLKLGTQLKPDASDAEVLVRIKSSGVNPSEVKKRAAGATTQLDEGFIIPHSDGAGIIEAVGAGVSTDRIAHRLNFDEIVKSHELVEAGGTGGCVIVHIDDAGN